jgi:hypothetical protein
VAGTVVAVGELEAAVKAAAPGATLLLRGGTHTLSSVISTPKALTIAAYPGETPVITHPTARPDFLYFKGGPVVVRGITFAAGASAPSYDDSMGSALSEVEGGHHVLYEDCTFIGAPSMGERQQLVYVRDDSGSMSDVTFRRCTFIANGTAGFGVHVYPGPGPRNIVVEGCEFRGFGTSAAITAYAPITIRNNTFIDSRLAIQLRSAASGSVVTSNQGVRLGQGIEVGSGVSVNESGNSW